MPVNPASFRTDFPAFGSIVAYPDTAVQFWIDLGTKLLNNSAGRGFQDVYDQALELFVAHKLAVSPRANATGYVSAAGGGAVSSKSVGPGSISYDTGSTSIDGAGDWNATTYGRQFYDLVRMFGAGGIQL